MNTVERSIKLNAQAAQEYTLSVFSDSLSLSGGELKGITSESSSGSALTVFKNKKEGNAYFSQSADMEQVVQSAMQIAEFGDPAEYNFAEGAFSDRSLYNSETAALNVEDCWEFCLRMKEFFQELDSKFNVSGRFNRKILERSLKNSAGADMNDKKTLFSYSFSGSITKKDDIFSVGSGKVSIEPVFKEQELKDEILREYEWGKNVVTFSSQKTRVLLTPNALTQALMAFSGVKGDSVFTGVSPLKDKIGSRIFDERISIIDDPLFQNGIMSQLFDDEGTASKTKRLVNHGVLESFITTRLSASRIKQEPSGNGMRVKPIFNTREFAAKPAENFTNLIMEPGEMPFEEMLAEMDEGIIIDSMFGLIMGNLVVGSINTSIDTGYYVKNGVVQGRVKNCAIGTNLYEIFLNNVEAVEDTLHFEGGAGASFYVPAVLLKDIYISA